MSNYISHINWHNYLSMPESVKYVGIRGPLNFYDEALLTPSFACANYFFRFSKPHICFESMQIHFSLVYLVLCQNNYIQFYSNFLWFWLSLNSVDVIAKTKALCFSSPRINKSPKWLLNVTQQFNNMASLISIPLSDNKYSVSHKICRRFGFAWLHGCTL